MKQVVVLIALIGVASCSVWTGGFRIRFDIGINFGGSFFFDVPRTADDAVSEGWTTQEQPEGLPVTSVTMYCYEDLVVCTFYDENGDVAGMQVALPVADFEPCFDMEAIGFTEWTVNDVSYWTLQQYFTTEEILASRRQRDENKIIENGGVWLVGPNKEVFHVANTTDELVEGGLFTRQACIPWMGRHYYYNMTADLSCTDEPMFPWFPIVESGELIATGFVVCGTLNTSNLKSSRYWFENPTRSNVELIVPDGPDCLYELADTPGLVTMHIYYVDQPWLVSCIFQ